MLTDKLRQGGDVHPMAFRFPTRDPSSVFFPTVHVHDGEVVETARFDHDLYWQGAGGSESDTVGPPASQLVSISSAAGLVDGAEHVIFRSIQGDHPNRDVWISRDPTPAMAA